MRTAQRAAHLRRGDDHRVQLEQRHDQCDQGGSLAVRHLLSTGRARIGHVTGAVRFAASRLRASGAEAVLAEAGLERFHLATTCFVAPGGRAMSSPCAWT